MSKKKKIIIGSLVLLCCCVAVLVFAWQKGDANENNKGFIVTIPNIESERKFWDKFSKEANN